MGHGLEPTCRRAAEANPSRIDRIVGNRAAAAALVSCRVLQTPMPTHDAVWAQFSWKVLAEYGWGVRPAPPLVLTKAMQVEATGQGPISSQDLWEEALGRGGAYAL